MIHLAECETSNTSNLLHTLFGYKFDITHKLNEVVEWNKVFTAIESFKDHYNDNMMRFVKSNLISMCIEHWSNGYLKYVDGIGYDFITTDGYKIELKSGVKMFQWKSNNTSSLIMKNMNGSVADLSKIQKTFDYVLIVEPGYAGITDWNSARKYMVEKSDAIKAKISLEDIDIFRKTERVKYTEIFLTDRIYEAMRKTIKDIDSFYKSNQN